MEITVFRKSKGFLSKRISLSKSGKVRADGSECRMAEGDAHRVPLNGVRSLAKLIESMGSDEALALGRLREGLPDDVRVALKRDLGDATQENTIARSGDFISYASGQAAYMLLDHDRKGMPHETAAKLKEARGFWSAVTTAIPALAGAARVYRRSTSSGLYHQDTGKRLGGSANAHVYIAVQDGADIERALKALHDRLWRAGYGYFVVGAAGQLLDRSIIDTAVCSPERLVFEGPPKVIPPLKQDAKMRRPHTHEGNVIDTAQAIPPLDEAEQARLTQIKSAAKECLKPEAASARKAWAAGFAARRGLSVQDADRIAAQAANQILEGEFVLDFDNLGTCTVAEMLANPEKYLDETLADPLEGSTYGRGKAKVLRQNNRCLMIHSFAHGGVNYKLADQGVRLEDFRAYKPNHTYIFTGTREPWPAISVNATIPPVPLYNADGQPVLEKGKPKTIPASQWLDQHQAVEQMTWTPGRPTLIEDWFIAEGGWIRRNGVTCINLYIPPNIKLGDPEKAGRWRNHVYKVFPDDADHIIKWLAQRVQRPEEKINHALVLGGAQGIGKDTLLEPVKHAVGPWNFHEASPQQIMGRFNAFLKSVILRVSEARDLGEYDRYKFYDHLKSYTASPPDVLRVDEKHLREYSIMNVCGVIITTNHKTDGIYLPADDRRHYVAWSDRTKEEFAEDYWTKLWGWYGRGGYRHAAAYLASLDISDFDVKAPPPKTEAFLSIVDVGRAPENAEMADALDNLGNPDAVTLSEIVNEAGDGFREWLTDRKNRRAIPHRMEACGYVATRNNNDLRDGQFVVDGRRQTIYAKTSLSLAERQRAACRLVAGERHDGRRGGQQRPNQWNWKQRNR
jgi:hypothetical protein